MELTSEVERIIDGTLVMTDKPLKAIQVSETTIKPNAQGIVVLSKQDALKVIPISSVPPVLEDPKISDVVEEVPIEVASPESLESFNVNIDTPTEVENKTEEPKQEEVKEEKAIEINLPEIQPVVAQEPTTINDNLFINSEEKNNNELESVVPTIPEEPKQEEVKEEKVEEVPTLDTPIVPEVPVAESTPAVEETPAKEKELQQDKTSDNSFADGFLVPDLMLNNDSANIQSEPVVPTIPEEPKQEEVKPELPVDTPNESLNQIPEVPAFNENSNLQLSNVNEINEYVNKFVDEMKKDFDAKIELFKNNISELMKNKSVSKVEPSIPEMPENDTVNALDFISGLKAEDTISSPTIPMVPALDNVNNTENEVKEESLELPTIDEVKSSEPSDDMQIKGMFI